MIAASLVAFVLARALALLDPVIRYDMPPVQVVDAPNAKVARELGHVYQPVTLAFVRLGDSTIYINSYTDMWSKAQAGDRTSLIWLAATLAHERIHVKQHGSGHVVAEAPAYAEELRILRALGAPNSLIHDTERARDYALRIEMQMRSKSVERAAELAVRKPRR